MPPRIENASVSAVVETVRNLCGYGSLLTEIVRYLYAKHRGPFEAAVLATVRLGSDLGPGSWIGPEWVLEVGIDDERVAGANIRRRSAAFAPGHPTGGTRCSVDRDQRLNVEVVDVHRLFGIRCFPLAGAAAGEDQLEGKTSSTVAVNVVST